MPLIIDNITDDPGRADHLPHRYRVSVNRRPLAVFHARRDLGYAACLRAAADAIERQTKT